MPPTPRRYQPYIPVESWLVAYRWSKFDLDAPQRRRYLGARPPGDKIVTGADFKVAGVYS